METVFTTKEIPHIKFGMNKRINDAIGKYRNFRIPMSSFLKDFLAVKSKGDQLALAENPWAYLHKGIEGYEIESGVSVDETAFCFYAMKLKNDLPSDVIHAAFYNNQYRNDSDFEVGYLLPIFIQSISSKDNVLLINPSPSMICAFEELDCTQGDKMYAVPDDTVANLYHMQFPNSHFYPFSQLDSIRNVDVALITNRDQKNSESASLLSFLSGCNPNARIMGLIPNSWFDTAKNGNYLMLEQHGLSISQALLVDAKATCSTPRKKMLTVIEKGDNPTFSLFRSSYNEKTRVFTVDDHFERIEANQYLKTNKTLTACWKDTIASKEGLSQPIYNKPEEYQFSKEISLHYRIYSDRKNKFAGVAYYREIKELQPKVWGKIVSPYIEKGLRSDTKEGVICALDNIIFNDKVYPFVRSDIETKLIGITPITLKTLWLYCWSFIADSSQYDHEFMCRFFQDAQAANIIPQARSGETILESLSLTLSVNVEDIPYKYVNQVNYLLKSALDHNLIPFNPLDSYMADYTRRASERLQDVRNALVKKHLWDKEEQSIFTALTVKQDSSRLLCVEKSLLLGTAIRLFTGMSIREVSALTWEDFREIGSTQDYQFLITKFVDQNGKQISHTEKQNWKRFRIIPSARVLTTLLLARKQYLLASGIDKDYILSCPIVMGEERISDMKSSRKIGCCKPQVISKSCNELIKHANIPENTIVLPDSKSDLVTDFNRYHGDIFQTNFRDKANHSAFMTIGEINYILGIDAPDTFSRHYCDYTNDYIQLGMIQKLSRWTIGYEREILNFISSKPSSGMSKGDVQFDVGPYKNGVASVDLIIENTSDSDAEIIVNSAHGMDVETTFYEVHDD